MIQQNAIRSWLEVAPEVEVMLLGDDPGVAEAAERLGARHVPELRRNESGTPLLDSAFRLAEEHARHATLCYVNADILLPPSLARVTRETADVAERFLVVGECWNVRVDDVMSGSIPWEDLFRRGKRRGADAIDYFVFRAGLFEGMPPFAVGRMVFDNWLVWQARSSEATIVDATWAVRAIHQDHSYAHVGSIHAVRVAPEALENRRLAAASRSTLYSRYDATHRATPIGLVRNPLGWRHSGETVRRAWAKVAYSTGIRKP